MHGKAPSSQLTAKHEARSARELEDGSELQELEGPGMWPWGPEEQQASCSDAGSS